MVIYCVAHGCKNLQDPRNLMSFHTFSFKRPEILHLWINAMRRQNWKPTKTSRICGTPKKNFVPSIFSFPKRLMKATSASRRLLNRTKVQECLQEMHVDADAGPSVNTENEILMRDAETQTRNVLCKNFILRRRIKALKEKIKRRKNKIKRLKDVISEILKQKCNTENLNSASNQRRYSSLMKEFAHTLYFYNAFTHQRHILFFGNILVCQMDVQSESGYANWIANLAFFQKF